MIIVASGSVKALTEGNCWFVPAGSAVWLPAMLGYLTQLRQSIVASMIADHDQLDLTVNVDDSAVAANVSICIGLIVIELVINASNMTSRINGMALSPSTIQQPV